MAARWQAPNTLSRMAFGVSGPHATPFVSPHTTQELILTAFDGGITAFDTGPAYGAGEAERRLGRALKSIPRDSVFISTKAGVLENKTRDFSPKGIRASLDRSLDRLGCDYVDALFMHGPGAAELNSELAAALSKEKQNGRVRMLGIAGRAAEIDAAIKLGVFDLLMAPVHGDLSADEAQRLSDAQHAGMGVFGIEVLTGASAGLRWPRTVADLWYGARAIRHGKFSAPHLSVPKVLQTALQSGQADVVMVSTTRKKHLQDALRVLDEAQRNA